MRRFGIKPSATIVPKGERRNTRLFQRILLVAIISVGFAFVAPAQAHSPKVFMNNAWAKKHAQQQLKYYGWPHKEQWSCLKTLWHRESGWRLEAQNKTPVKVLKGGKWVKVYAGGIPQILGMSPKTPATTQIRRGLIYIKSRYGSPCQAINFWNRHYWY